MRPWKIPWAWRWITRETSSFRTRDLPHAGTTARRWAVFYGREKTAGDIYTIAGDGTRGISGSGGPAVDAELEQPSAAAVDKSGNVVFIDQAADVVWVVAAGRGMFYGLPMTAGDIYVVAGNGHNLGNDGLGDGGPAPGSTLNGPDGVAIDPAGALLVGDESDNRVRAISS
jgi:hypothetical protein